MRPSPQAGDGRLAERTYNTPSVGKVKRGFHPPDSCLERNQQMVFILVIVVGPILSLIESHGCRASLVVVRHMVDATAHGIAPHQPGIAGSPQIGCSTLIPHARIEP